MAQYDDPIPGIIPFGSLTMLAGAPGVGKTTMIAEWIARWRSGRTIWGHATNRPAAFAYIAADRHWSSHAYWFQRVQYPDIPHYCLIDDAKFDQRILTNSQLTMDVIKRCLDNASSGEPPPPGSLVVIDPAVPFCIAGSQNSPREVAYSLISIARLARERQYTIILVGHFGKQKTESREQYTRPQDRIAGSYAFSGFSDTQVYMVGPEEDQPYTILGWNPRQFREETFKCVRDDETGLFVPYDEMREDMVAFQVLDCHNAEGVPTPVAEIRSRSYDKHGHSRATVTRALDRLLKWRRTIRMARGVYVRAKLH